MTDFSDKAVTAAQEEYNDARSHGVEEWFAMKLALEHAVRTDQKKARPFAKSQDDNDFSGEAVIWFCALACAVVVLALILRN